MVGLGFLVAALVGPIVGIGVVGAQSGFSGGWTDPAPIESTRNADVPKAYLEAATGSLAGQVSHPNGIAGVDFTLYEDNGEGAGDPCRPNAPAQAAPGSDSGTTNFRFGADFPCNRNYKVRATARSRQSFGNPAETRGYNLQVAVAVPPPTVGGVRASLEGDDATDGIRVRWTALADAPPDFLGYDVARALPGGDFEPLTSLDPGTTAIIDSRLDPDGGEHRYRVIAVRSGPDDARPFISAPASATAAENVPPAPDDAPAPGDDGGGGSGDGDGGGGSDDDAGGNGGGGGSDSGSGGGNTAPRRDRPDTFADLRARQNRPPADLSPRTATTIDGGFGDLLPFDPDNPDADRTALPAPLGDGSVALLDDGDFGDDDRRAVLIPIAGGLALFMGAMVLRVISRRAGELP